MSEILYENPNKDAAVVRYVCDHCGGKQDWIISPRDNIDLAMDGAQVAHQKDCVLGRPTKRMWCQRYTSP